MAKTAIKMVENLDETQLSNGAEEIIAFERPYTVSVTVEGVAPMLLHRWNDEAVAEKAAAKKGSAAKKSDNTESYVYRDEDGHICIPAKYLKGAVAGPKGAAKFRQDPRSPRKSALDLYNASVIVTTNLAKLNGGVKTWDYLDRQRVVVQRSGITRERPAFNSGWKATFDIMVTLPQYINPSDLREVLVDAGRLCGLGDYRPTYGRFGIVNFEILGE